MVKFELIKEQEVKGRKVVLEHDTGNECDACGVTCSRTNPILVVKDEDDCDTEHIHASCARALGNLVRSRSKKRRSKKKK